MVDSYLSDCQAIQQAIFLYRASNYSSDTHDMQPTNIIQIGVKKWLLITGVGIRTGIPLI